MQGTACRLLLLLLLVVAAVAAGGGEEAQQTPVVLMHGLFGNTTAMQLVEQWIRADYPNVLIRNVEIGDGRADSLLMPINQQVAEFARIVGSDAALSGGFNAIGVSQGGLITRAYVERYNDPPVHNLITWVGPHQGTYGVPVLQKELCDGTTLQLCQKLEEGLAEILDHPEAAFLLQNVLSFVSYWQDPFHEDLFAEQNIFLADINNVKSATNATYKKHLLQLNHLVLVESSSDEIVYPHQSEHFGFWAPNQDTRVMPFNQTRQYTEDLIGLRTLFDEQRLSFYTQPCGHIEVNRKPKCRQWYELYTAPYLNNTLADVADWRSRFGAQ